MGVSPGLLGTARMQYQLRQCFVFLDSRVLNKPEVMIGGGVSKFDAEGKLTDERHGPVHQSPAGSACRLDRTPAALSCGRRA